MDIKSVETGEFIVDLLGCAAVGCIITLIIVIILLFILKRKKIKHGVISKCF